MSDDLKKKLDDLSKSVERLSESYDRSSMERRSWNALENAIGTVKMARDMYASSKPGLDLIEEAAKYLDALAGFKAGSKTQPYSPTFLLHFAIAMRAMTMSPVAAQEYYKRLGETFVGEVFK